MSTDQAHPTPHAPAPPPGSHDAGTSGATSAPVPPGQGASRWAAAARSATAVSPVAHGGGGGSTGSRMLAWAAAALVALGVAAVASGAVDTTSLDAPGAAAGRSGDRDGSWSYYHDRDYDSGAGAAKWATDRSRSIDPDEAVLGSTTRWEYDGPYRYGPYGSDGMRRRATGRERADPLYSQQPPIPDVFRAYGGDLDPSGGQPVGVAPSRMTTPYYDPYAGYSNPYSNRIRLAYGEGVGRGASYTP